MGYSVQRAYIILDDNSDIVDWRDTEEDALTVVEEMEQEEEDKADIDRAFEEADN